jgi:hypothetical protein
VSFNVDWTAAVDALVDRGSMRCRQAMPPERVEALRRARPGEWVPRPAYEGGVRLHGHSCCRPLDECPEVVLDVATELTSQVSAVARSRGWPEVPAFNEVCWGREPDGEGGIVPHRDPPGAEGLIAVFTLRGCAMFELEDQEWPVTAGDLVILRGRGWPTPDSWCPVHGAGPPIGGLRENLQMRFNVGGAGANYFG